MENFYSVLGVAPTADRDSIRRRYRALAWSLHPDRCGGDGLQSARATAVMARIGEAYATLQDPHRRAAYDQTLLLNTPSPKEQRSQALVHVTTALAEVLRQDLLHVDQSMINRILQGSAEHLPRALEMIAGKVSVLEGATQVAAYMALAKTYVSSFGEVDVDEGYDTLIHAVAEQCVQDLPWGARLVWPERPAATGHQVDLDLAGAEVGV